MPFNFLAAIRLVSAWHISLTYVQYLIEVIQFPNNSVRLSKGDHMITLAIAVARHLLNSEMAGQYENRSAP